MNMIWQRSATSAIDIRALRAGTRAFGKVAKLVLLALLAGALFWIIWIYGNGLRDARYLDGWILAAGCVVQIAFHAALKSGRLSPRWAVRWRTFHIWLGYLLIAAFASHVAFSLPDTGFEWALGIAFGLISMSGLFGVYLAWSLKAKQRIDTSITFSAIPQRRADIARQVHALVTDTEQSALQLELPGLPHDVWIADLYRKELREFLNAPRNATSHLMGSQRPIKLLLNEIDGLSKFVDRQGQDRLAAIKSLVVAKDELDFARVHLWLSQAWLFVHVPATYALAVLAIFHIIVVYAFSSGAW